MKQIFNKIKKNFRINGKKKQKSMISLSILTEEEKLAAFNQFKTPGKMDVCYELKTRGICTYKLKYHTDCPAAHSVVEI